MNDPFSKNTNSLMPGEVGGHPVVSNQSLDQHPQQRSAPGQPGNVKIGRGILQVELPKQTVDTIKEGVATMALHACKAIFDQWKEHHPNAPTPIRYSQCSKTEQPSAPIMGDNRAPAPKGQQH